MKEAQEKLQRLRDAGEEGADEALQRAMDKEKTKDTDMQGFTQAWSKQNPGKTNFEFGGADTQKLY